MYKSKLDLAQNKEKYTRIIFIWLILVTMQLLLLEFTVVSTE